MPTLHDKQTGQFLGTVSDADIEVLVDQLEEEHQTDEDFFVDSATIDLLEEARASDDLVSLLRAAVGATEGIEVRYKK